jgi:hypothetical protein
LVLRLAEPWRGKRATYSGYDVSSWLAKRSTVSLTVHENGSAAEPRSD